MLKTLSVLSRVLLILAGSLIAYGSASACKCAVRTVACGMSFDVGSEYLIYAFEDGGLLATGLCAGNVTTSSEYALQEIAELDRLVEDQLKQTPGSLPMEGSPCSGG